jgi:SAM-dependent methyltransferase
LVVKRFPARPAPPAAPDAELLGALHLLRQRREPYAALLAEIVAETLDRFAPLADRPIVEIGAGTGQLREWLPVPLRERMIHTDPSEPALRLLRERAPAAKTRVASAHALPMDTGTLGAVLGLCVFDALQNEQAVVAELGRVLAPGGRFVHVMDMATLLEAPFQKLGEAGLVPIPNVFGDPGDHEWPLDIVLVKRDWLAGLLDFAVRGGHPVTQTLRDYVAAFCGVPFHTETATPLFKAIASSGGDRRALRTFLETAGRLAFAQGYPAIAPLPFHSGRYLQSVLETCFRENDLFRIECNEIVTRSMWRAESPPGGLPPYLSLCLGHQRLLDALPERLLNESARTPPQVASRPAGRTLTEVGAFVFVAVRTA